MIRDRVLPVVVSVLVIVAVAIVQERSRFLAATIAAMPLTAPLAMWIVFSASDGDQRQTADFMASMAVGTAATLVFVVVCWIGLRQAWGFAGTLIVAFVLWLTIVAGVRWIGNSWR
jgi:hypothetical protein